jgi:tetraacyldisaccharide 4'-kinase
VLPDAASFKRLVDGSHRGVAAATARAGLAAVAVPYGAVVRARNAAYDMGLLPTHGVAVPVISIGNLTLGGTGKTPLVAWAARTLDAAGLHPAIVSRGYGAARGEKSDEAAELGLLLPGVPHVADRDRVAAARAAVAAGAKSVVIDDGFQHRRLARDLDIVAVDATDPFGCGRLFPRGLLREPLTGLARADAIVLTRAGLVDERRRQEIRAALSRACGDRMPEVWAEAMHRAVGLRTASGQTLPLDELRRVRIAGFSGIGNPAAFGGSLQGLGAEPLGLRAFPDHHRYRADDLADLSAWGRSLGVELLVTTLKDLVKIGRDGLDGLPVVAVEITIDLLTGADELSHLVQTVSAAATTSASRRGACASAAAANTS